MLKNNFLIPEYMKKFSCTGPKCEDSCCQGWTVNIDYDTYIKINSNKHKKNILKEYFDNLRIFKKSSKIQYAKIELGNKDICPLWNKDKLCTIHLKLGEEYLSRTCKFYPRKFSKVNDIYEVTASISCPEITRLVLLNSDLMEFEVVKDMNLPKRIFKNKIISTEDKGDISGYLWELRGFTIEVLQNRDLDLSERLIFLGLFYKNLNQLLKNNNFKIIPQLVKKYVEIATHGKIKELISEINLRENQKNIQIKILKKLIDERFNGELGGVKNEKYLDCFKKVLVGLNFVVDTNSEKIKSSYNKSYDIYSNFMEKHSYIFENYLVNYVFSKLFPLNRENSFESYVRMITLYAIIKLHLIGLAGYYKYDFSVEHVVKLFQSLSKTIEHNHKYLDKIYKLIKEDKLDNLAVMTLIIKN
jgi:lysine-N-methylase